MLNAEMIQLFNDDDDLRKQQILKAQEENKRRYNLRRRPAIGIGTTSQLE